MSRVIGGRFRGHVLSAPSGQTTRPTSDRVREAVFSSLVSWLGTGDHAPEAAFDGVSFLDLYAGSGAVGIEAASRGASPVRLVERDPKVADVCRANAARLRLRMTVTRASVPTLLAAPADHAYDIVWLDPPYAVPVDEVSAAVAQLDGQGWLAPDGLVVVERATRTPDPVFPDRLADTWSRRYGETTIHFATRGDIA